MADRLDGRSAEREDVEASDEASEASEASDGSARRASEAPTDVPPPDPRRDAPDESERIAKKAALTGILFGRW